MSQHRPHVAGVALDPQTRCAHYGTPVDIIAIKMRCCGTYYACKECHDALADHAIQTWPHAEWYSTAVLCGACGFEMTVRHYLACADRCPRCSEPFNPRCSDHYHLYFEP